MPLFTLSDLLSPSTKQDMVDMLLSLADSFGLPTTAWQSGQPIRTWILTAGQKLADLSLVVVEIAKGGFGDLASDSWATKWAKGNYDVDRGEAEAATGELRVTNLGDETQDFAAGEFIVAHEVTGKTYRNVEDISLAPADEELLDASVGVEIAADEVGTASNAAPDTIRVLVNGTPGIVVTNAVSILGNDRESKSALVSRARGKLAARSPMGVKQAYDTVARDRVLAPTTERITRTNTVGSEETGEVTAYLATAAGAPSGGDVTIVQAALDRYAEPWCTQATAAPAVDNVVAVTYQVWLQGTSLTVAQIKDAIANALATYFSELPVGGFVIDPGGLLFVDSIRQVIGSATPGVVRVVITLPADDVAIDVDEVPKLGTVIGTVTVQ